MTAKEEYKQLIETARNRVLPTTEYTENHHILPVSMGGTDKTVKLTLKEHFRAHQLLEIMTRGTEHHFKMNSAIRFMCSAKDNDHLIVSAEEYEYYRGKMIEYIRGRPVSEANLEGRKKYYNSQKFKDYINSDKYQLEYVAAQRKGALEFYKTEEGQKLLKEKAEKAVKNGIYAGTNNVNSTNWIIFDPFQNKVLYQDCLQLFCRSNPYIKTNKFKKSRGEGLINHGVNTHIINAPHYKAFRAIHFEIWKSWTQEEREAWVFECREIRKRVFNRMYKIFEIGEYFFTTRQWMIKFCQYVRSGLRGTIYSKKPWYGMQIYRPFDYDVNIDITQVPDFDNLDKEAIGREIWKKLLMSNSCYKPNNSSEIIL